MFYDIKYLHFVPINPFAIENVERCVAMLLDVTVTERGFTRHLSSHPLWVKPLYKIPTLDTVECKRT